MGFTYVPTVHYRLLRFVRGTSRQRWSPAPFSRGWPRTLQPRAHGPSFSSGTMSPDMLVKRRRSGSPRHNRTAKYEGGCRLMVCRFQRVPGSPIEPSSMGRAVVRSARALHMPTYAASAAHNANEHPHCTHQTASPHQEAEHQGWHSPPRLCSKSSACTRGHPEDTRITPAWKLNDLSPKALFRHLLSPNRAWLEYQRVNFRQQSHIDLARIINLSAGRRLVNAGSTANRAARSSTTTIATTIGAVMITAVMSR